MPTSLPCVVYLTTHGAERVAEQVRLIIRAIDCSEHAIFVEVGIRLVVDQEREAHRPIGLTEYTIRGAFIQTPLKVALPSLPDPPV